MRPRLQPLVSSFLYSVLQCKSGMAWVAALVCRSTKENSRMLAVGCAHLHVLVPGIAYRDVRKCKRRFDFNINIKGLSKFRTEW